MYLTLWTLRCNDLALLYFTTQFQTLFIPLNYDNLFSVHTYMIQCDRTTALDSFFDLHKWDSNRTYIATYCCGCSIATVPVAEISHYWNIPHVRKLCLIQALNSNYI